MYQNNIREYLEEINQLKQNQAVWNASQQQEREVEGFKETVQSLTREKETLARELGSH